MIPPDGWHLESSMELDAAQSACWKTDAVADELAAALAVISPMAAISMGKVADLEERETLVADSMGLDSESTRRFLTDAVASGSPGIPCGSPRVTKDESCSRIMSRRRFAD